MPKDIRWGGAAVEESRRDHPYSCNETTMRGAAKSLATPLAASTVNITEVSEMEDASIFQCNSRHQGDFSIFS